MTKFEHINPRTATGDVKEAFNETIEQFGAVINLFKVADNAPNVLKGILALNKEVNSSTELDSRASGYINFST